MASPASVASRMKRRWGAAGAKKKIANVARKRAQAAGLVRATIAKNPRYKFKRNNKSYGRRSLRAAQVAGMMPLVGKARKRAYKRPRVQLD